jgi:ParB-like chromosome segregation protein Spo0J
MGLRLRPTQQEPRELTIVRRPIDSLTVHDENARAHPDRQVRALARAIETFGIVAPIMIDRDNKILAGHARVEACKRLEWQEVPTIMIDDLDPAKARAFMVADNRIS